MEHSGNWTHVHGERLSRLEGDVRRLESDRQNLEAGVRDLRQIADSMQRVVERSLGEIKILNEDCKSAVARVTVIEKSVHDKLVAEEAARNERQRGLNYGKVVVGFLLLLLSGATAVGKGWFQTFGDLVKITSWGR